MSTVFVTTSAYGATAVHTNGQDHFVPIISQAGGSGIEIRRELFEEEVLSLQNLRRSITQANLTAVYSAPVNIWQPNGELNSQGIRRIVTEALELGAALVKFSLGHYQTPTSNLVVLQQLLEDLKLTKNKLQFTVENDQTTEGGNWQTLHTFLSDCKAKGLPVKMTFDIGNWHWTGQDAEKAARALADYVVYIHCKQIQKSGDRLLTVPLPKETAAAWRVLLTDILPQDVPRAIEFPLHGSDLQQVTKLYVDLLANA